MKRSEIKALIQEAKRCFQEHGWSMPPNPKWDVTDFGLGDWRNYGLVLLNLAEENEYCEKLMYAKRGMITPAHCHRSKKEDIISRFGDLQIQLWNGIPNQTSTSFELKINNELQILKSGQIISISSGERITIVPGIYHEFQPLSQEAIIGEVSTANNDLTDNFFANLDVQRIIFVEEDCI